MNGFILCGVFLGAMFVKSKSELFAFSAAGDTAGAVAEAFTSYIDSVQHDSELCSFGMYLTLNRDHGIRPDDLAAMSNLLTPLIVKNPTCRFTETEFRAGVLAAIESRKKRKIPTEKPLCDLSLFI